MSRSLGRLVVAWAWGALALTIAGVMLTAGVLVAGLPGLELGSVGPALGATAITVVGALLAAAPLAVASAVAIDQRLLPERGMDALRAALDILDGVPGLVLGVLAAVVLGPLGLAGALAALCAVALAPLERGFAAALSRARSADRLAAVALGATRWQVLRRVVGPAAAPAILGAVLRAGGRLCGAAAPLLLVGPLEPEPLALIVVRQASQGAIGQAAASGAVLVLLVVVLHGVASAVDRQQTWSA